LISEKDTIDLITKLLNKDDIITTEKSEGIELFEKTIDNNINYERL